MSDVGTELLELRKSLKSWENDFREQHGHKPGRDDITSAPSAIQESYTKYNKLRKQQKTEQESSHNGEENHSNRTHLNQSNSSKHDTSGCDDNDTTSQPDSSNARTSTHTKPKTMSSQKDVWGAHLNKSENTKEEEKKKKKDSDTEHGRGKTNGADSVLKSYSKKLYSNKKGMSKGPRDGMPFSGKQDFWAREETGAHQAASACGPSSQVPSTGKELKEKEEAPALSDFFGTKLGSRSIRLSSQTDKRASLDSGVAFRGGLLTKARKHSFQKDWLEKCEKENDIGMIPGKIESGGGKPFESEAQSRSRLPSDELMISSTVENQKEKVDVDRSNMAKQTRHHKDSEANHIGRNFSVCSAVMLQENSAVSDRGVSAPDNSSSLDELNRGISSHEGVFGKEHSTSEKANDQVVATESSLKSSESRVIAPSLSDHHTEESGVCRKRQDASPLAPPSKRRRKSGGVIHDSAGEEQEAVDGESQDKPRKGPRGGGGGGGGSGIAASAPKRNLNENFVRLNMLTKSYRRKGRSMGGEAYKRMKWKQRTGNWGKGGGIGGGGRGRGGWRGGRGGRGFSQGTDKCFKCGGTGHWASKCDGSGSTSRKQCEEESEDPETVMGPLPTLEEAALAAVGSKPQPGNLTDEGRGDKFEPLSIATPTYQTPAPPPSIAPLFEPTEEGVPDATPRAVFSALKKMGYESFRPGQEQAIMRILSGLSTLVVLSTGAGKSLCYQLPAYMYNQRSPALTLVISPLVSLMEDQVLGLPRCLKGARLHSHMTKPQREKVHAEIQAGKVQILLVSPEAVVGGGTNCLPHPSKMPPIAFACVDEAHCISVWSHNFRPSYLMLCKVLKERLGVRCTLALTATATLTTSDGVANHLGIADQPGAVIRGCSVPNNLCLSVSKDRDRERALVELLKGLRFCRLRSIIVYCIRRDETERIASLIRTCLPSEPLSEDEEEEKNEEQEEEEKKKDEEEEELVEEEEELFEDGKKKKKGRKRKKKEEVESKMTKKSSYMKKIRGKKNKKGGLLEANSCEAYHAGMSKSDRNRVQNGFMSGSLRIVVATVAFGMGLDKADVRSVIHFNLPRAFESFVQEIGRAGRDGLPAHCHIFLDDTKSDIWELRRHTHGNSVDRFTVKKLVQRIFKPCRCAKVHQLKDSAGSEAMSPEEVTCPGHLGSLPVDSTVQSLDIKEEGIATLLCYLELHPARWLVTHPHTYASCTLSFYGGPREQRECALRCPALAAALARERGDGGGKTTKKSGGGTAISFDVVELVSAMGWELAPVKRELRQLQWKQDKVKGWVRTGVMVEFSELAFLYRCRGNLTDAELDGVVDFLYTRVSELEEKELGQLNSIYATLERASKPSHADCCDDVDMELSEQLRHELIQYFVEELDLSKMQDASQKGGVDKGAAGDEGRIRGTVRQFIGLHQDRTFTGRAVARILQGIASPCYPAQVWGRDRRFWRSLVEADFKTLIRIANEEVMRMR